MAGSWFSLQIQEEGNSVDIWLHRDYDKYSLVLDGICPRPFKARPVFNKYDLVLFDLTDQAEVAEEVMKSGVPCIGDGNLNTSIENDRALSIEVMEECGINVPFYEVFDDIGEAKKFVRKTNKRYVFKPDDVEGQNKATTYVSKNAEDMLRFMDKISSMTKTSQFILQEVIEGTEISTEAWFNGQDFFLITGTIEEKKFMEGGKGPNTGCSGNLEIVYDQVNYPAIFREGLQKTKDFLQEYKFRGYIDLNTIVTAGQLYGLEWTPRFGYDCTSTLFNVIENVTDFMGSIASGGNEPARIKNPFACATRISVPPYPSEIEGEHPDGIPIEGLEEEEIVKDCYLYDCCLDRRNSLITVGIDGDVCVPIANGASIQEAWAKVRNKVKTIQIPDMQYRDDLHKTTQERYDILARQGWLR